MIGKTLAHYEITALLGEGGMGAVYRATDTKLGREVAVKVLTGLADHGSERIVRFQQEARTIAALNHPNIVTLHAVEEADGVPFLVMELVDGVRLTTRIEDEGLDLDGLLQIAVPIADAVSTAHRQGITHRDLKPDNVMIDGSGRVKVLDFGLAKLLETADGAQDATRTIAMHKTAEGRIMGTAAYMSPEQAEGKPVDARSDVFSLGIVLYEMATGRKPFDGETAISTISSIVKEQPRSALEINRGLPRHLGRILDRCLAKDPDRRYQSAIELRNELELLDHESKSGELEMWVPSGATGEPRVVRRGVPLAAFVAAIVVVGLVALFGGRASVGTSSDVGAVRITSVEPLTTQGNSARYPSLSPSGDLFVYEAVEGDDFDVFLQRFGGQRPINLTADHDGEDRRPAVSPDGQRIAFESSRLGGGIHVMGTTGENVRFVVADGFDPAWSPDGDRIVYTTSHWVDPSSRDTEGVLYVVDLDGGSPHAITPADMDAVQPDWSPDGARIVFWGIVPPSGQRDLFSVRADGTGFVQLTDDEALDYSPRFGHDGRWVWFTSNRTGTFNLWRIPIDPESGERTGAPEPVTMPNDAIARFDVKADRVAFGAPDASVQAVRIDLPTTAGVLATPTTLTRGELMVQRPRLSPDGTRIAFFTPIGTGTQDIYVADADGSNVQRLTNDAYRDRGVAWYPDGDRLVFYSDRSGSYEIWSMRVDGSDLRQLSDIAARGEDSHWFPRVSPDGRRMATFNEHGTTVWTVDPTSGKLEEPHALQTPDGGTFYSNSGWHPRASILVGGASPVSEDDIPGVWTVDVEADTWTEIVESADARWLSFAFSPDGSTLYATPGSSGVVAMDLADAPFTSLDDPRIRRITEPLWLGNVDMAPDGDWLLAESVERNSEIWGAALSTGAPE